MPNVIWVILASTVGGIVAGILLKILTQADWIRILPRVYRTIITLASFGASIVTILSLIIALTPPPEWGVRGRVIDRYGREPLGNAHVIIEQFTAQTGNEGTFMIEYNRTPVGTAHIRVERDNYLPWQGYVPLNTFATIELEPEEPNNTPLGELSK
jgi:hypothetical protein